MLFNNQKNKQDLDMSKTYTYEELKAMGVEPVIQMSPSISGVKRCSSILLSNNDFSSEIKAYNGYNIED